MTPQEAIEKIKWTPLMRCNDGCVLAQALNLAIKALEKQIPKKPMLEGDGYCPEGNLVYDTWFCPNCDKDYEVDYDDFDYCPNCGQHIDWSE